MDEARGSLERSGQERSNLRLIAEQQELDVGMALQRQGGARHDHRCALVAPHGVERDTHLIRHGLTLAPSSGARNAPSQAAMTGRGTADNSVSARRHNTLVVR